MRYAGFFGLCRTKEWHEAVLGLALQTEHIGVLLQKMQGASPSGIVNLIRGVVTELIDWRDEWGDLGPDLEPSLGFPEGHFGRTTTDDREAENEHDEEGGDDESSLGSLDQADGQTRWGFSSRSDREEQCEDEGSEA